jgi:hypothetical protein
MGVLVTLTRVLFMSLDPIKTTKVVFQNLPVEGYEHVENIPYSNSEACSFTGNPTQNASIELFHA